MAWRLGDLLMHLTCEEIPNDFMETALHHIVALFLVVASYLVGSGGMNVGVLVMVIHDICDIFSSLVRVLGDSDYQGSKVTFIVYLSFLAGWCHLRVYLLPQLVYQIWVKGEIGGKDFPDHFMLTKLMSSFLGVLWILHLYWTYILF